MYTEDDNFVLLQHVVEYVEDVFPNFHVINSIGLPIVNFRIGINRTVYQMFVTTDGTLQYFKIGSCKEDAVYCSYLFEILDYLHDISNTSILPMCTFL